MRENKLGSLDLILRLDEHRRHVNRLLLDAATTLDEDSLHRTFGIGQGSIWKSLTHLYAAEHVWLEALLGDPHATLAGDRPGELPGSQRDGSGIRSLSDLRVQWDELGSRWDVYLAGLATQNLDEAIAKVSTSSGHGQKLFTRKADVLLHLSLHAQYTTAQIINMLCRLGISPLPDVMLISLARRQHPSNPIDSA